MIKAQVVADSISPAGKRLTGVAITAHRFILAEINTHRMLSRSYRSSRAVPSKRLIEEVRTNPAMPLHWGANERGMQAAGELDDVATKPGWIVTERGYAKNLWRNAAVEAARAATLMTEAGLHKQIANRVLEPFLWVHGIITATEWDNFFGLRLHAAAQPEFRALADAIWGAMKASRPVELEPGEWHLPFIDAPIAAYADYADPVGAAIKVSVARCARVSYESFETGKRSTIDEDLRLYDKLLGASPIHASPAEHQATPDTFSWLMKGYPIYTRSSEHGNLIGWRQYRKMLPGEAVAPLPEGYL